MAKILECIPNFSEGKDQKVIDAIIHEITAVEGVTLWFSSSDEDYNRTCAAFIGEPEAVKTAMINAALKAGELIDMRKHKGAHPRVGATDVVPFVPIDGITVEECVAVATEVARTISEKLGIPTYLYSKAAASPSRPTQAQIQSTQYEALFEKIKEEGFEPDFGPCEVHPIHGATMVGVREQIISFNFTLNCEDIKIAKRIAKEIRESSGGLKNIKSIGVQLANGKVQVSVDDVDYQKTPLYKPYEMVKLEAERYGTSVLETEIIGMIPSKAFEDVAKHYMKIQDTFDDNNIIDKRLYEFVSSQIKS